MHSNSWSYFALSVILTGLTPLASAQELPIRTTIVDDRTAIMMPIDDADLSGSSTMAGVDIQVSADGNLRTYSADYLGRTYTAHASVSAPPTRFAFDTGERRFRLVSSTIRVALDDYEDLDQLILERGALTGKAYPHLGFALIELPAAANPAEAVEFLDVDPRVRDASVLYELAEQRPMIVRGEDIRPFSHTGDVLVPANAKESLTPNLFIYATLTVSSDFKVRFTVGNSGRARSEVALMRGTLFTYVPDETTADRNDMRPEIKTRVNDVIPALDAKGAPYRSQVEFSTNSLEGGKTYYLQLLVVENDDDELDPETLAGTLTGFTLDSLKRVQHVCVEPGRSGVPDTADPLLAQQWHLENTAQTGYAANGGVAGEDLGMADVLVSGPDGAGVKVAVVDSGLEICHPDLRDNMESGASFNFNASLAEFDLELAWATRLDVSDPFNYDATGGHGTGVAGLIAAAADNGIGGRGIAPSVQLRGYNGLQASSQFSALIDSLGVSTFYPNSTDVHIFNMSFGSSGSKPDNIDPFFERVFTYGVNHLRSGLGAVYVKSAGNAFRRCNSLVRDLNASLGCGSANGNDWNNLPYLIVVGAFNADGRKASYASAGANIWVSAPGGDSGSSKPALLTTDQMGWDRGLGVLRSNNPLDDRTTVNRYGDYTGRMNGTSAAAAIVSGAVAVLLEKAPDLTWRDIRHILATTARQIDSDIAAVSETIGTVTRTLRQAWIANAAGYNYHNWYGFGAVDLDAAVEMAEDFTPNSLGDFRQTGWFEQATPIAVPDNNGTGVTQTLNVSGLPDDASIEAVILEIDISHEFPNDLGIHLVSPGGTRSVVNQVFNETLAVSDIDRIRWRLLSNAFYGEGPNGDWQINVFDAADEDTGDLDAWRLRIFYGAHPEEEEEDVDATEGSDGTGDGDDAGDGG